MRMRREPSCKPGEEGGCQGTKGLVRHVEALLLYPVAPEKPGTKEKNDHSHSRRTDWRLVKVLRRRAGLGSHSRNPGER